MSDDEHREIEAAKKELLDVANELRKFRGKPPLRELSQEHCSFCGEPKQDVGALVQGLDPSVFICRQCIADAQHAFLRDGEPPSHE